VKFLRSLRLAFLLGASISVLGEEPDQAKPDESVLDVIADRESQYIDERRKVALARACCEMGSGESETEDSPAACRTYRAAVTDVSPGLKPWANICNRCAVIEIPETTNVAVAKLAKGYGSGISGCTGRREPLFTFGYRRLEYCYRAHRCEPGLRAKHI
jgi:hypothetical protein